MGVKIVYDPGGKQRETKAAGGALAGKTDSTAAQKVRKAANVTAHNAAPSAISVSGGTKKPSGQSSRTDFAPVRFTQKKEPEIVYDPGGQKREGEQTKVNVGKLLADTGKKGLNEIAKGGSSLLAMAEDVLFSPFELLSGHKLGTFSDNGVFNRWNESISNEGAAIDASAAENMKNSKLAQKVYEYGAATINAVPQALLAIFTAGGSAGATAANMARQAAAEASPGVASTVGRAVQGLAKDKNFWTAASQVVGRSYEDALSDGASMDKALLYAIGNGLMNAAVEVGGGIQTLPAQLQSGASAWKTWVNSMLDEGKEEVVQGVIERAMQNAVYEKGNPIAGVGDGAVFDTAAAAQEFAGGAVVGGVLGGGQVGLQQLMGRAGRRGGTLRGAQQQGDGQAVTFDGQTQNAAERLTEPNAATNGNAPTPVETPVQAQESSPVQGAEYSWQQVVSPDAPLGVSATQESNTSVPQKAGNYKGIGELLGSAKRGRVSSRDVTSGMETMEDAARFEAESNSGLYGLDANDNFFRIKPEEHIDNRESHAVGDRRMNAFQFDHPELHPYYVEAAKQLQEDMRNVQRGGEIYSVPDRDGDWRPRYLRTRRVATDAIVRLKDGDHLTYAQIDKALSDIIADRGQENYAAAKRVELVLDKMLSEGYTGSDGEYIPDPEYLRKKAEITGAQTDSSDVTRAEIERTWQQRMQQAEGGFFDGQVDTDIAENWAQQARPEGWEQQYEGQEPPVQVTYAPEESPFTPGGDDGLGGADRGSLNSDFQNMQAESDRFHPVNRNAEERIRNEQSRAPSEVPEVNPETRENITKTVSTILNAPITSPEMAPIIEQSVAEGRFDYAKVTDQAAMDAANRTIDTLGGYQKAAERFSVKVELGQRITKEDFALGVQCYNEAVTAGDAALALELAGNLADAAHTGAQVTQAVNLLNRLTPAGKLLTLRRYMDKLNRESAPKRKRRGNNLTADERRGMFVDEAYQMGVDEQLATDYLMAETDAARAEAWQAIINDIASRVKPTVMEKWNYWRYTSMLTNPVTHIRNFAGNSVQGLMRRTKNAVGMALESASKVDAEDRTKALLNRSEEDRARLDFAKELYEQEDKARAMGAGKYTDGTSSGIAREIENARKMFGEKYKIGEIVQKVGDKNSQLLDKEDVWFNKPAYVDSLAQAMKAKGITAEEARAGVKPELMERAREYAVQEAAKATYRDFNDFSNMISKLGHVKESDNPVQRIVGTAIDAVMPFRRTPANILVRGVADYSPVGLMRGVKQAMVDVKTGTKTASEAIDTISTGLTGTGILLLGALLAKNGLLHARVGDDDKEEDFLKSIGYKDFALQIGDRSYTLDWLVPAAMPLFAGAAIMEGFADDKNAADAIWDGLTGISDVMLKTSMLSSLDSLLENAQYANNKPWYYLSSALINYLSQGIPTVGGKIANVLDDKVRKAFVPKNAGEVSGDIQYAGQSVLRKIPGGRNALQPMVDVWGNEVSNGDLVDRLAASFVSPGFYSTVRHDAVTDEVRRLAEQVGSDVYPGKAKASFTVDGKTVYLTGDQYTAYAKKLGQTRHKLLEDALRTDAYKSMKDVDRAKMVGTMYEYANAKAKRAVVPAYSMDKDMKKYAEAEKAGISAADWYVLRHTSDADGSGGITQDEAKTALDRMGLTDKEKAAVWPLFNSGWKKNPYKK